MTFKVNAVRTLTSPYRRDEKESGMYETIYYLLVNMRDLPENIPMDVNPRVPKMGTNVAKRLIHAVVEPETDFYVNNRGIVISAQAFSFNSTDSEVTIDLGEQNDENDRFSYGILDGGHTYTAIMQNRDKIPENIEKYVRIEVIINVLTILDNKLKGIRIRQGNMLIGDKGTCNGLFKEERFNGWMIGELHVFDNDLVVNARRDYFEQNEAHYDLSETFKEWSASKVKEIRKLSYERTLSETKKAVVNAADPDDVNDLFVEDFDCYSESDFIDREEVDEIVEIDYMDKLSWLINQKQGKTKYMALNINNRLTPEQKKVVENIFDIIIQKYKKDEAEQFINIIASNL